MEPRENTYEVNAAKLAAAESRAVEAEAEAAHDRAELSTVIAARDKAIDDRNEWRHGYERETNRAVQAEAKVAALTRLVAQSSTQYREMVKALDECRRGITSMIARTEQLHDSPKSLLDSMTRDLPDMVSTVEHIDAAMKRSTP